MNRMKMLRRWWPLAIGWCLGTVVSNLWQQNYYVVAPLTVFTIGMALNIFALSANSWRMPVRGRVVDTPRHITLSSTHRYPYLTDTLSLGPLMVSIGDVLIVGSWPFYTVAVFLT